LAHPVIIETENTRIETKKTARNFFFNIFSSYIFQ
jgi:hypothetical protein